MNSHDFECEYCGRKFSIGHFDTEPRCPKCGSSACKRIPKSEKINQYSDETRKDPGFKLPSDWSD